MYEDFDSSHPQQSEESETWPYSYPSYTRFTFTAKPKSRLGRSNRQGRLTVNKNESAVKENTDAQSGENCSETSLKAQPPKTPGINWLKRDTSSVTNPFTPGKNIFMFSNCDQKNETNNTDSGIDISSSSQSTFFSTLKNVPSQSFKHNSALSKTPFRGEEDNSSNFHKQKNAKELFPKVEFPSEAREDNKENFDKKSRFQIQEHSFDPSWNQLKRICDAAVLCPPGINSESNNFPNNVNRNNCGRNGYEPFKSIFATTSKDDDDSANTPLDLSSGDSLTIRNVFRGSATGNDQSLVSAPQIEHQGKEDEGTKQKNPSDAINSILPTFLVPVNKIQCKKSDADGTSSEKYAVAATDAKLETKSDLLYDKMPKLLAVQTTTNSFQLPSNKMTVNEEKNESLNPEKQEMHMEYQPVPQQKPSSKDSMIKDVVVSSFSSKIVSPPSTSQQASTNQSIAEKKPDTISSRFCDLNFSSKDTRIDTKFQTDVPLDSVNQGKLTSTQAVESKIQGDENTVVDLRNNCQPVTVEQNMPIKENVKVDCDLMKPSAMKSQCLQVDEGMAIEGNRLNDQLVNPVLVESKIDHNPPSNPVPPLNVFNNTGISKPIQTLPNKSESNFGAPFYSQKQNLQNDSLKIESNLHQNIQTQRPQVQDNIVECLDRSRKPMALQHYVPSIKQPINNREPVGFNHGNKNQQLPTYNHEQKTYLAPRPSDHKIPRNDFHPVQPEVPQQMGSRPSFAMMNKPQDSYKMPPPRGRLTRSNGELFVNGKGYTVLSILGKGGSSEVYQVLDPKSSKLLAVKCVDLSMVDRTIAEGYLNEIDLLSKLQGCASVIKMFDYEYIQEYKMLYVVMEKGDTDLSQLIRDISKTKKISMSMIIYYWTEMLMAVRDIHEQGIIHSDLKPANFLLVSGRLKLIDFGIASSQGDMTSVVKEVTTGTWNYMSPEAIRNSSTSGKGFKITYKSDVWSLGCILYNLVYGKTPFSHITNTWGKLQAIADSSHQIDFPEVGAPKILVQALRSCFHRDPKQRPTVAELLSLPYHATNETSDVGRQVQTILPKEWWLKVSHLFPEVKSEDNSGAKENKDSGGNAV